MSLSRGYTYSLFGERRKFTVVPCRTYILTTPAAGLPISLAEVKQQARLDPTITSEDSYLTLLIQSATNFAEQFMRRDLLTKTYTAYMDNFPFNECSGIEIRKSILQSITSIQYLVSGVPQTYSSSNYYFTQKNEYSSIYLDQNQTWPTNADPVKQAVSIVFVAGYGASETNIPVDIRIALLQHVTFMYQSRGDSCDGGADTKVPDFVKNTYQQNKIYSLCEDC